MSQKPELVLKVDNFVLLNGRRVCNMLKFPNFVSKKYKTCISVHLNILCLFCAVLHKSLLHMKFDKMYGFYTIFNSNMK